MKRIAYPLRMLARPLGNTGLGLSAIGLGGHWPTDDGRRYEDHFADDEVPAAIVANRTEVVGACLDVGINYIDITTGAEALAYGQALIGRRDRFIIGADDYLWSARNAACINVEALTANVERCLARLRTDYLDIWRVTAEVHGRNTDAQLNTILETANRLKTAGKIRHLGLSSHHAGWLLHAVTQCPELELVLMPCLPPVGCLEDSSCINQPEAQARVSTDATLACASGWFNKPPPEHRLSCAGGDVCTAASQRRLGIIGIKPFAGGAVFAAQPTDSQSSDSDDLARLALRWILQHRPEVTCVVPGLATVAQVRNAAAAAGTPAMNTGEISRLKHAANLAIKALPAKYAWLANWTQPRIADCDRVHLKFSGGLGWHG